MGHISKRQFEVLEGNTNVIYRARLMPNGTTKLITRNGVICSAEDFNRAGEKAVKQAQLRKFKPLKI